MTRRDPAVERRVERRLQAERLAESKAAAARADLARELANARDAGYSVRALAELFGLQPTSVQRLIASVRPTS
jgi:predicted transcriptional regulator